MNENEIQVQANLWKVFDIYKSAGVFDEAQIVEGIAFYALVWQLRDDPILKKKFKLDNSQYKDLAKFILQAGGTAAYLASSNTAFGGAGAVLGLSSVLSDGLADIFSKMFPAEQRRSEQSLTPSVPKELNRSQLQDITHILFE